MWKLGTMGATNRTAGNFYRIKTVRNVVEAASYHLYNYSIRNQEGDTLKGGGSEYEKK